MTEHSDLTGADLHELKGAATAAAGTVPVADGAGSTAFEDIISPLLAANKIVLNRTITDISAPGSYWVTSPMAGTIERVDIVLDGTITVGDATVTLELAGTLVTSSVVTVAQAGSIAGSTFTSSPSALNEVAQGQAIEIITDGNSTTVMPAHVTLLINTEL